ncbi:hypothetical protein K438DRAFT_2008776 [Mycena galopus ATCC 62051]|nr:hypothetical protein K438DRAFT_2008776 [Mycena galopus ATCC 62051]
MSKAAANYLIRPLDSEQSPLPFSATLIVHKSLGPGRILLSGLMNLQAPSEASRNTSNFLAVPLLCPTDALADSGGITIQRGMAVFVDGGSAGTCTAFRLQQVGLRVALLEKNNRLGGHVNTFRVSTTTTFDFGVLVPQHQRRYQLLLGTPVRVPLGGGGVPTYTRAQWRR